MRMRIRVLWLACGILLLLSWWLISAAEENKKFEYGILIDSTGSMRTQFETVLSLAKGVTHQVHDHGPVSVFCFESQGIGRASRAVPTPRVEHTQDESLLIRTIDNVYIQGGQTTLLDAIEFMADRLNRQPSAADKVIILITDGEDRVSERSQKEVIRKLTESKASVYAIGLVRQLDGAKRSKAIELLKVLTKGTGGRVVFPKSDQLELHSLLAELALPIQ